MSKDVRKSLEFIVEDKITNKSKTHSNNLVSFKITADSLKNVKDKWSIPKFFISGKFNSFQCKLSEPFTEEVIIEQCETTIKTCGYAEGYSKDVNI